MNVLIGSMFRDSAPIIDDYLEQIVGLRRLLEARGDTLRWVAVENDSQDETLELLDERTHSFVDAVLVPVHDDCPYYPSIDMPERWRHHAWVQNHVLEEIDERDDRVVYVESDLVWMPDDILALIDAVHNVEMPAVTGAVYHGVYGGRWYDSWGTTRSGVAFNGHPPYHPEWHPEEPIRVDTCASVIAVDAGLAARTRFQPEDAFRGWCRDIYDKGGEVWLDPTVGVIHP